MSLGTILLIIILLACVGSFPGYGYNRTWGYAPFGGIGAVLVVVLVLVLLKVI